MRLALNVARLNDSPTRPPAALLGNRSPARGSTWHSRDYSTFSPPSSTGRAFYGETAIIRRTRINRAQVELNWNRDFLPNLRNKASNMIRNILATTFLVAIASPAFAQAAIETPTSTTVVVPPGAPGVVTRQSGSTGAEGAATYSPTGRAADGIATDSAAAGNAGQPSRVGSTGSTGGGNSGQ